MVISFSDTSTEIVNSGGLVIIISFVSAVAIITSCGTGVDDIGVGADPGVIESPIAYIKRPIPTDDQGQPIQTDLRRPRLFVAGGDVYIRSNSTATATETNITSSVTQGIGDVKGLNSSYDGKKLIFSLRISDSDPNDNIVPSWNIYEYDIELSQLSRIISSSVIAEGGDDLFPAYLPDERIIFSSSRQRQSSEMLASENKPRFSALDEDENTIAMVLHVMDSDGSTSSIHQVSFNQSHDLNPIVLTNSNSGQVLFSRWSNAGSNSAISIYKANPDGSEMEVFYGDHSAATGTNGSNVQFSRLREMSSGNIMAVTRPFTGSFDGGDIVIIDAQNFVDNERAIWSLNGMPGPGQESATINNVTSDGSISRNGRFQSAYPLSDGSDRMLISKSTCQLSLNGIERPCVEPWLSDPAAVESSPAYALWLYDRVSDTQKVVVLAEVNTVIADVIALEDRPVPTVIFDRAPPEIDSVWQSETVGVINIKSVYDFGDTTFNGCFLNVCTPAVGINTVSELGDPANATADQRPARFVRFIKAVSLPDSNDPNLATPPDLSGSAFGRIRNQGMREIVGYAPVEPDGSVKVKVPANLPLAIDVLDDKGRRIGAARHENWFQVRPGDETSCSGCHNHSTANNATPLAHQRSDAIAPSINDGLPSTLTFANTQIPGTPNPYFGQMGQTMAEVRFDRTAVPKLQLSSDVVYTDVWTDPGVRALDIDINYLYSNLDASITSPASLSCTPWTFTCRIVINYEQHIHPIWQIDRGVDNSANGVGDDTCTECHTNVLAAVPQVPLGQLDLSAGLSDLNMQQFKSYRELFFTDAGETLDAMGIVVNIQISVPVLDGNGNQVLDAMGNPVFELIDDPAAVVANSASANGARSSYLIEKLTETELEAPRTLSTAVSDPNYVDHSLFLNEDELRLISEWLDIGAQYFNDPFDPTAPQN